MQPPSALPGKGNSRAYLGRGSFFIIKRPPKPIGGHPQENVSNLGASNFFLRERSFTKEKYNDFCIRCQLLFSTAYKKIFIDWR